MSAKFAAQTEVPVERSRTEIETTPIKYGATGFLFGWDSNTAANYVTSRRRPNEVSA